MKYRVISDATELARNTLFVLWPVAEIRSGQLALFEVEGNPARTVVGRWYPTDSGDFIYQPYRLILVSAPVRALGLVIPCEDPPDQITDLADDECERILANPGPRMSG